MKTTNSFKLFVILVLLLGSYNLYAVKDEIEFGPFSQDMVLTFDISPTSNWSDFYIKPPIDHENYAAGHFQTRLLFGGGTVLIHNGTYQSGLEATNFTFKTDGTKYNFRITLYENPTSITVEAKVNGATNWIVLFNKAEQAYGSVPVGIVENNPAYLNITNFSAVALSTGLNSLSNDQIEISPNLVDNKLNITSTLNINSLSLYSETGSLIKTISTKGNNKFHIDVQYLNRGIYFVHLNTKDGNYVKKFIKK